MPRPVLRLGATEWDWSRPYILGILNVTPDSFSDGGRFATLDAAMERGIAMVAEGADALDIGGESTRPGAAPVTIEEECARVVPVIHALSKRTSVPLSVDTMRAEVARRALDAGAQIVNDVGMGDPAELLGAVAAAGRAAYIAMHARGTPSTMTVQANYGDLKAEVAAELRQRAEALVAAGVAPGRILVDPGVGFAKIAAQSLDLLADLAPIQALGYAVCVGPSRKSFIAARGAYSPAWGLTSPSSPDERLGGTAAAVAACVLQGVEVLRVHDVAVMREAARVAHALATRRSAHA